jgi:hypothetical protein
VANPAQLLLNQLNAWRSTSAQQNPASIRGLNSPNHQWLQHRIAVRHLDAIDELLSQMEAVGRNTSVFRRHCQSWGDLVFAYPNGWKQNGTAGMDQTSLDHLENLADRLDDFVPKVRPGGLDDIRDYANGIRELLDEDDSIDELLKLHVRQVIAHLNWCIDNYAAVGDFDLQEAVERLASAVIRAAAASSQKDRWKARMDTFVWPFVVNVIAAIPGNALAQLALGH